MVFRGFVENIFVERKGDFYLEINRGILEFFLKRVEVLEGRGRISCIWVFVLLVDKGFFWG